MAGKNTNAYKYGYQGSEKDNEVSGSGNSYTTEFRQLDPRLGRWFSVDPIFQPWQSPYTSMDNNPICLNDPRGDTPPDGKVKVDKGKGALNAYKKAKELNPDLTPEQFVNAGDNGEYFKLTDDGKSVTNTGKVFSENNEFAVPMSTKNDQQNAEKLAEERAHDVLVAKINKHLEYLEENQKNGKYTLEKSEPFEEFSLKKTELVVSGSAQVGVLKGTAAGKLVSSGRDDRQTFVGEVKLDVRLVDLGIEKMEDLTAGILKNYLKKNGILDIVNSNSEQGLKLSLSGKAYFNFVFASEDASTILTLDNGAKVSAYVTNKLDVNLGIFVTGVDFTKESFYIGVGKSSEKITLNSSITISIQVKSDSFSLDGGSH